MRATRKFRLALTSLTLAALLLAVFGAVPALAATPIYVRTGGSDTLCDGTVNVDYSEGVAPNCAFQTIQKGVTDVDADGTVHVAAGTYDEQVVIDKSLTLQGAGDTTIVKPSSKDKLTTILDAKMPQSGTIKPVAGIIVANSASSDVTVKNLKVDGESITSLPPHSPATYGVAGVFYYESGGTIDSVSTDNLLSVKTFGAYLSAITNTVFVEVKNSTFINMQKNGVNACGSKLTANIHNNIVTGQGPDFGHVQNGIVVGQGAEGTVNYNTIGDIDYTGYPWVAIAICFWASDGSVDNNTITDCGTGIWSQDGNFSAEGNTVTLTGTGCSGLEARSYGEGGTYAGREGDWTVSFVNNTVTGTWEQGIGIGCKDYVDPDSSLAVTLDGNHLTGSGSGVEYPQDQGYGIEIGDNGSDGDNMVAPIIVTIKNNDIRDWIDGIYLDDRTTTHDTITATITGNTIQNNTGAGSGIHLEPDNDATRVQVHFNNIVGNTGTGVYGVYNGGTGTLDVEHNWWSDASGPKDLQDETGETTEVPPCDTVTGAAMMNVDGTGDVVTGTVDYCPWTGAEVEEAESETITGTATITDTVTGGDVTINATDSPTVTVTTARYKSNPGGGHTFVAEGYFDVNLDDISDVDSVTIEFCPASASTVVYYWDGTDWLACGDQHYENGCVVVTIPGPPGLEYLTGGPFASGHAPPIPVGGYIVPVSKVELLAPWIGLAALMALAIAAVVDVAVVIKLRRA